MPQAALELYDGIGQCGLLHLHLLVKIATCIDPIHMQQKREKKVQPAKYHNVANTVMFEDTDHSIFSHYLRLFF